MGIFIIGYMGAGKSTNGRKLARRMGLPFIDIDDAFESKFRYTIPRFFDQFGEERFRELEHQCLKEILNESDNAVISTGGGTPCYRDNLALMKEKGITVYFKMSAGSLAHRLKRAKRLRPVIRDIDGDDMPAFVEGQLTEREKYYSQADIIIKGEDLKLEELAEKIKSFHK